MNPAKEAALKTQVREACLILANGGVATRKDLFGDAPGSYGRYTLILQSLENAGLIESTPTKPGEAKLYAVKSAIRLHEVANSDVELSRLIWPSRGSTTLSPEEISLDAGTEEASESPQVNEATLKMLVAIVENVVYLRTKIDTIETKVSALNAVACAHCECPEAHE